MGKLARAQAAIIRRKKAAEGRTVTVTRRATKYTLTGWYGRGLQTNQADSGARVEISEREFFFTVADFTTAELGAPKIGDRFQVDGETVTFEVMTPATGEPAWRYSDSERTFFRIHTKRVK